MNDDRIKIPPLEALENVPVTVIDIPEPRTGDYVDTLAEWGALPDVLSLPEAAAFVAHRCGQNPQAIKKVLEDAVLRQQIRFWGLTALDGPQRWKPGFIRIVYKFKHELEEKGLTEKGYCYEAVLEDNGRLHSEATGVNAIDVVQLLRDRGRKVPPELLSLLPKEEAPAVVAPIQRSAAQEQTILNAIKALGFEPKALPKAAKGTAGVKSKVRSVVRGMSAKVFDKAWQRLRDNGEIAEAE